MKKIEAKNYGERWVLWCIRKVNKWDFLIPLLCFSLLGLFFSYFVHVREFYLVWFVLGLGMSITYYERYHFSKIIKRQQAQIEDLEEKIKENV